MKGVHIDIKTFVKYTMPGHRLNTGVSVLGNRLVMSQHTRHDFLVFLVFARQTLYKIESKATLKYQLGNPFPILPGKILLDDSDNPF